MRAAENLLHHDKRTHIMLTQPGKNALLNVYLVARIGVVAEISMNDRFTVIVQEDAEDGFARSGIVGTIKGQSRPRQSLITLLCAFPQPRDRLGHLLQT